MFASRKHTACTLENQTQRGYRDPLCKCYETNEDDPPPLTIFCNIIDPLREFCKTVLNKKVLSICELQIQPRSIIMLREKPFDSIGFFVVKFPF